MEKCEIIARLGAAYVLAALSVCACATFGTMLGSGREAYIYAAAFAAFDVIKFTLPSLAETSLKDGRKLTFIVALTFFAAFASLSITSTLGVYAGMVSHTSAPAKAEKERYESAIRDQRRIESDLADLPRALPGDVLARIEQKKLDRLFTRSGSCGDATELASRSFCADLRGLEGDLAKARQVEKLQARLDGVKTTIAGVNLETIMQPVNAQADIIASILAMFGLVIDKDSVPNGLAIVIALLIETSGLMMWMSRAPAKGVSALNFEAADQSAAAPKEKKTKPSRSVELTEPFELWLEACTMRGKTRSASAKLLLESHTAWAEKSGHPAISAAMLGRKLVQAGIEKKKVSGAMVYSGIAIRGSRALKVVAG